jgi:hypothetical protein
MVCLLTVDIKRENENLRAGGVGRGSRALKLGGCCFDFGSCGVGRQA